MPNDSSRMFGLDGIVVESVRVAGDGTRVVEIRTASRWVGLCPTCEQRSTRSKGWVSTRPRDIVIGPDRPVLVWHKQKWLCTNTSCDRKGFTESVPQIPPRARVTMRARTGMAHAVLDGDRSVQAVAAAYGCTWNTCHRAVVAVADPVLGVEPEPVRVLGIDETRRGRARWEVCEETGRRVWVDRWDTGLVDIGGDQGLLVQVNGRTSAVVTEWLAARDADWRAQITHVAIAPPRTSSRAVPPCRPSTRRRSGRRCRTPCWLWIASIW